jgi:hypothetical protein
VCVIDRTGNKSSRPWPASEEAAGLASARRRACGSLWKSQVRLRPCPSLSNGPQSRVRVIDRTGNKSRRPGPAYENLHQPAVLAVLSGNRKCGCVLARSLEQRTQRRVHVVGRTGNKSRRPWPAPEAAAGLASARRRACGSLWKSQVPLRPCPFLSNGPQCRVHAIDRTGNKSRRPPLRG